MSSGPPALIVVEILGWAAVVLALAIAAALGVGIALAIADHFAGRRSRR